MSDDARKIENAILVNLPAGEVPTEEALLRLIDGFSAVYPISPEEREALIRRLHSRLSIRMDLGVGLISRDHEPWLLARRPEIDPRFWDRYAKYLFSRSWTPAVVGSMDKVSDEILDVCGDPKKTGAWARRGLVMGDVQSGKTATYTALCCKAADAGYGLIVLLTGTLESLRRQTQKRLDEGFVGLDSTPFLSRQRTTKRVCVGLIDPTVSGAAFTSRVGDFSTDLMTRLNFRLAAFRDPVLLVIKKNSRILKNLEDWLRDYNAEGDGRISTPVLLIDDEADNASVNVAKEGEEPRAINARIRSLLNLFHRSTYVGFTATPFANIFIDPDSDHEMLGDDLFPRNFLYALDAPTNYIGAEVLFAGDGGGVRIEELRDAEACFPPGHKADYAVSRLPDSLLEAVRNFIIANAIRDLRMEGATHRSMLVNVSRFTNVQTQVAAMLDAYLRVIQQDIRHYGRLPITEALQNASLESLHSTWKESFKGQWPDWGRLQASLKDAALPITVMAVNQRTGADSLNYAAHEATGLRVIAVGGNSLSRGLTLEGLSESYFFRNSQMYDTLMQMGRWFGYRDGFADVCRVWLTSDARHWYTHIQTATAELRAELQRMKNLGMTPEDFGLKVRAHPDGLIVTARNKMRTAKTVERMVSASLQYLETPRLIRSAAKVGDNADAVKAFVARLAEEGCTARSSTVGDAGLLWENVPKSAVTALLRRFLVHPQNFTFQPRELADYIDGFPQDSLARWDVAMPGGRSTVPFGVAGDASNRMQERVVTEGVAGDLLVSGRSARVASRGAEREGLSPTQIAAAESEWLKANPGKSNIPDHAYRLKRTRPLLLIHVLDATLKLKDGTLEHLDYAASPLIALGLSFPDLGQSGADRPLLYRINLIEWRSLFENETDEELEVDDVA